MAKKDNKEPTTVTEEAPERKVDGKVVNPRAIEWPFDPYGFTSMLKKEGVRAVGRIKGDDAKLDVFLGVLGCLAQHAKVKVADQNKEAAQTAAALENQVKALYVRSIMEQEREIERLKEVLKSAEANLEAKKSMPGEYAE